MKNKQKIKELTREQELGIFIDTALMELAKHKERKLGEQLIKWVKEETQAKMQKEEIEFLKDIINELTLSKIDKSFVQERIKQLGEK